MIEKWLIRLYDADNGHMIASYYTENPEQNLKTFYFCKEHDMDLHIPDNYKDDNYEYNNSTAGSIYEINVGFGNDETFSYIDIWLENIY